MRFLRRVFGLRGRSDARNAAFHRAMQASDDLIDRMRAASRSNDPIRAIMADLWAQRGNVPYVTTVFEATQEMNAPVSYQRPEQKERKEDDDDGTPS